MVNPHRQESAVSFLQTLQSHHPAQHRAVAPEVLSQQVGQPQFQASLHGLLGQQQLQQAVLLQVQRQGLLQLALAV